jgi:hypothetical protein
MLIDVLGVVVAFHKVNKLITHVLTLCMLCPQSVIVPGIVVSRTSNPKSVVMLLNVDLRERRCILCTSTEGVIVAPYTSVSPTR